MRDAVGSNPTLSTISRRLTGRRELREVGCYTSLFYWLTNKNPRTYWFEGRSCYKMIFYIISLFLQAKVSKRVKSISIHISLY